MFKRFLSYYEPQMGLFVADTVCALVLAAIDLAFPIILRNLTGGLFTQGQAAIMQALGMIAVGLALMYAIRCACRYFVSYWGHVMGARMESKMREDLFDQYVCDPLYHCPGAGACHGCGNGGVCGHHVLAEYAHARGL